MAFWKQLRPALWILGVPVALVGLLIVAQVLDSSFIHTRTPERFLIPEGYKGWVRIEFSAANSPAVPIEDGYLTFRFNPDGTLKTSSKFTQAWRNKGYSWAHDQYSYVSKNQLEPLKETGWCGGGMIWGNVFDKSNGSSEVDFSRFYVGSESDYRHETDPAGRVYKPCP